MGTKHTPGPWEVFSEDLTTYAIASKEMTIGSVLEIDIEPDEAMANARLIAAAPELLDALERLYRAIDSCIELTPELLQEVKSVIEKAK